MGKGKGSPRWIYRGSKFDGMRDIVHSMTRASLKEKKSSAKPGSKEYEDEFNRLVQVYNDQRREESAQRKRQDAEWEAEHRNDSDEEILAYVRSAVQEQEQYTKPSRVDGGRYIAQRFGGWPVAVHLAGIQLPEGYQPAAPEAVEAYLRKRGEASKGNAAITSKTQGPAVSTAQPERL